MKHKWYATHYLKGDGWYACRNVTISYKPRKQRTSLLMHRVIMNFPNKSIDHINRNSLDNRKCNLRICTHSQNNANAVIRKNNTSGLKGVSWNKYHNCWEAYVHHNFKKIRIGYFKDKIKAGIAFDKKAKQLFGDYALLNFPGGD